MTSLSPVHTIGDNEVIGSWNMIEMQAPRICRICGESGSSLAISTIPASG